MTGEITVNGRKKLATLQKEFSEAFNYLFIAFIDIADIRSIVSGEFLKWIQMQPIMTKVLSGKE
jgi:hypothetical protein